ncbi:hypothetical protein BGZ63DRAFT_400201 [Mariannaea sp. PMI_226]|nr:hypothetical protein BGZ63DRAFT_400201 [Mariannaea sp. PMI_226]
MGQGTRHEQLLSRRSELTEDISNQPYDPIPYLERAVVHVDLGYPDLAAGDAYRALLLTDEALNEGFEFHEQAFESLQTRAAHALPEVLNYDGLPEDKLQFPNEDNEHHQDDAQRLATLASIRAFQLLSMSLLCCGCLQSAADFCVRGLQLCPKNNDLINTKGKITAAACRRLGRDDVEIETAGLPDRGLVRREVYPWNDHEPDRFSPESLADLNSHLKEMAPKCAVEVATLPILVEGASTTDDQASIATCKQLGVFAQEDIEPGEAVLKEYSLLTANNRLKDALCDACSCDLPPLGSEIEAVSCPECYDTVFCSQFCFDQAQERYHPAICEKDVDAIAKDPDAFEADDTLYLLLLSRVLAIAAHEEVHPLDVREVKYIWGDFVPAKPDAIRATPEVGPPSDWTLPFSFKYNLETPLHILEKMDVDMYATLAEYDLWVLNTLYSKFRGTASARKSLRDGRPDVAAVHPYWCLANHDCDPNVTWEWGGRMVLEARRERVVGKRPGGIKRGEEILNHYCDVNLAVQDRREWAAGSLGGWCMCKRCRDEAAEEIKDGGNQE